MFVYIAVQVTKLIEESTVAKTVKNAIDTDKLLDWLVENSVLSIALEGKNMHHIVQQHKLIYIVKYLQKNQTLEPCNLKKERNHPNCM